MIIVKGARIVMKLAKNDRVYDEDDLLLELEFVQ